VAADESFDGKAITLAEKSLAADPKLVEARELIARLKLEDSDTKGAVTEADAALALSPAALDAMAIRGTVELLADQPAQQWFDKILAKDPHYGRGYEMAANILVLNRRYEEAIEYYKKAVALSPWLDSAYSNLGINLMRLGREAEARTALETAYNHGWKDSATVNSLRLMDSYKNFVTFKTDNTILRLQKKEADVLHPYFETEMKRSMAAYDKKYQMRLPRPVQVEVYPDHEDFAVRTMGMPGLGALGVTFEDVIAMDSPSGRRPGDFHWASTLWHEMSHVYVLTATHFRVPRWFTEGMAVHEETAASPDWGDRLTPDVILAIKNRKLLPIAEIDRGFVHPSYPAQVVVSYFQAGKICDYIAQKWGEPKLLAMVHAFARTTTTDAVVRKELGLAPAEFDKQFNAWLDASTKATVDHYAEWRERFKTLHDPANPKSPDEVIRIGLAIRDLYPDFVESGNVYAALADAYTAKGDTASALDQLQRYSRQGGRDPATVKRLATLLEAAKRPKEAAAALERLNYIVPQDADLHKRLGSILLGLNDSAGAIREFSALVATKPLDQAGAHYDLARAYHIGRQNAKAREEVETSLEAAPGFKPAQKLLLELSAATSD
ncbi:MAG: tetratricopeptide repeat protein, partial [Acidobacteriota bacterium]|nr:tetratricopeptide repeat protein [Acidobacteriota bacterium]